MPGVENRIIEITQTYGRSEAHEVILRSCEDYKLEILS